MGNPVALLASAELRLTRGFISITTMRPFFGSTANWMLDPPVSTPISRMIAIDASRMMLVLLVGEGLRGRHRDAVAGVDAHGVEVFDGADDHHVVGFLSRMISSSYSFQPITDSSIRISLMR